MKCIFTCVIFLFFLLLPALIQAGSLAYGTPIYTGEPKTGTYNSAKDYWAKKREAFKKGNRKYPTASNQSEKEDDTPKEPDKNSAPKPTGNNTKEGQPVDIPPPGSDSAPPTEETTTPEDVKPRIPENYHGQAITMEEFEFTACQTILRRTLGSDYSESGATQEEGFSATGLVSFVFTNLGYPVKNQSPEELWANTGLYTDGTLSSAKPGDLLFFKLYSKKEGRAKLTVAICFSPNVMVYPSFTAGKVLKKSCDSLFWKNRFVGAKRILRGR